jgi:Flp pilus assembly protein TadG
MVSVIWTKLALGARRLTHAHVVRRFIREQSGIAAVEFGFVALPFLALIFAILETSLIFFAGQAMETAVSDSARLIMTGQAQQQGFDKAAFKNAVCAKIYGLFDCQNGIYLDVKTFTSFANITMPSPVDQDGNFVDNTTYTPGGPGDIVVVRMFYQWPVYVSLLGLDNMAGGKRLMVSTAAFRNEPYATTP